MIHVDFIDITRVSKEDIDFICEVLPDNFQRRVKGNLITKKTSLLGRALLYMNSLEFSSKELDKLTFSLKHTGKLYLEDSPAFNISHGGKYVALAISSCNEPIEIGLDIEKNRAVNSLEDLSSYFALEEQEEIYKQKKKAEAFLKIWTRKEAFYKAIGTGIYTKNSLKKINCLDNKVNYKGDDWYFNTSELAENYWVSCVSNKKSKVVFRERNLKELKTIKPQYNNNILHHFL
ncbi:4'-phosphopantetheinyl transferase family protein [Pseudofulvibacter geojedonensis]|uniref:4'-phosphopantetheinyl transferase family protein n=1 Tax=Pseudofulvibacter geojedonensis TaxID=1123758 RepID=A0ABW3I0E5_9FLAO